jgi:hypothetical protein
LRGVYYTSSILHIKNKIVFGWSWRRAMPSSINGDPWSLALLGVTNRREGAKALF